MPITPVAISSKPLIITVAASINAVGNNSGTIAEIGTTNSIGIGFGVSNTSNAADANLNHRLVQPYIFVNGFIGGGPNIVTTTLAVSTVNVYTVIYDKVNVTTRLNGATINTTSASGLGINGLSYDYNSITFGDINLDDDSIHFYYKGSIGQAVIYQGNTIDYDVEEFIMRTSGL